MVKSEGTEDMIGKSFSEFVSERMAEKRVTVNQLEKETDVQRRYLEALVEGDFQSLPAAPYVRGYVHHIAPLLKVDPDELWELYQKSARTKRSGSGDILPGNRFTISQKGSRSIIAFSIIILLLLVYLVANGRHIFGAPIFVLNNIDDETHIVTEPSIALSGRIDPDDTLTLNDELISIDPLGQFETVIFLEPGLNTLQFRVKRFLGREKEVFQQVIYEIPDEILAESEAATTTPPIAPPAF